ncbi:FAD-binding protein [bacterium]|nr:MAG: FAD-binding protein [bacterium]
MLGLECDVAVIGGGICGLAAAAEAAELGASVVCIEPSPLPGGQVANVGVLGSYPAPTSVSGAVLAETLKERFATLGGTLVESRVTAVQIAAPRFEVTTQDRMVRAHAVIIASGGRLHALGVPGEGELSGRGVSQCDWCDGGLFRDADVAVVGGGDAALQAALHLGEICRSVAVIVRGSRLRARRRYLQAAAECERIAFHWETVVEQVLGKECVEGVVLRSIADGSMQELPVRGVFVFVGADPNVEFLPPDVQRDARGLVETDSDGRTSVPGVFAAGAVRRGYRGLIVNALSEGAVAAAAATEYLQKRGLL